MVTSWNAPKKHPIVKVFRRLQKVFEALQEGVLLLDTSGGISFINHAGCRFFGTSPEEAQGKPLDENKKSGRQQITQSMLFGPLAELGIDASMLPAAASAAAPKRKLKTSCVADNELEVDSAIADQSQLASEEELRKHDQWTSMFGLK